MVILMDKRFIELIKKGWKLKNEENKATYIDEVFLGAIITTLTDNGYVLMDIASNGNFHYFMFEHLESWDRIKIVAEVLPHSLTDVKVIGARMFIEFSYGVMIKGIPPSLFGLGLKGYLSQMLSNIGSIRYEYDGYYTFVNCATYLLINDYIDFDTLTIDWEKLNNDINAIISSLAKYLEIHKKVE
ncbi:hypothetical protein MJ_1279 [Methanocaldococcus jannaschii DSM 2661]|uniref:Uncharacterized protein MJ1279 n=2 Tax=Methanocaldococcus jannaschii TaxID=2190 RepID=Y1279_METJA|nr:RecName: Full=Uncharacterized protein MJ1279 [Methanocaldococcus jannaschii DSM 2661]AAB99285.1 hypothetical protein MJ_1279 [Methanocaldococcus jannaschii DSM 2661]